MDWSTAGVVAGVVTGAVGMVAGSIGAVLGIRGDKTARRAMRATERQATAAEEQIELQRPGAGPTAPLSPDDRLVRWTLDRVKHAYTLRNVGTATATGVTIAPTQDAVIRDLPANAIITPGGSWRFMALGSMQARLPDEVTVEWDGASGRLRTVLGMPAD